MKRLFSTTNAQHSQPQAMPRLRIFTSAIGKQWIILPATLAVSTAIGVAAIGLLFYVRDVFQAPTAVVSIFAATWTAFYAVSCIALRPLSVRMLPRYSLILATGSMAVAVALIPVVGNLAAAFALYAMFGMALSFFWPPLMGWLSADLEQKELSTVISRFNLSWSTGTIISPFLGGLFYQTDKLLPVYAAFTLLGGTALAISIASALLPRIRTDSHRENHPVSAADSGKDNSTPLRFPARFALFATYFTFGIITNVLPLHLRDHLALSESSTGLFLLFRSAVTTGAFILLGRYGFWHFRRSWIFSAQILVLAIVLFLAAVHSALAVALALCAFGLGMAMAYNNSVFHGISGSRSRATRMAIHESTLTAGVVAGSLVGGPLYQAFSINAAFLAAAALSALSALAMTPMLFRARRPTE